MLAVYRTEIELSAYKPDHEAALSKQHRKLYASYSYGFFHICGHNRRIAYLFLCVYLNFIASLNTFNSVLSVSLLEYCNF